MRRIWLAIRIFFRTLFNAATADRVAELLDGELQTTPAPAPLAVEKSGPPTAKQPLPATKPVPSEALTLLAALQREARFIDFVQESLEGYSDAQIGSAARDVHRECAKLFERMFALRPVVADAEGAEIELPVGFDAGRYRLTGKVTDAAGVRGRLVHHGWEATLCELPTASGSASAARVIAPAEVELR